MNVSKKSLELFERSAAVMPGGHSNLKMPLIDRPLFFARGKGARLYDVDGNDYIEFWNGAGPGILGYCNEEYTQALKKQLDTLPHLFSGVGMSQLEIEVSEKITQHVPCAEKVRFAVTGTEAVQLAIRLARAFTSRPYFIRFEGHYHGWMDNVLGGMASDNAGEMPFPIENDMDPFGTAGRDSDAFRQAFLLPWNDIDMLESVLQRHGGKVALIHMEPILCNGGGCPPRPGYLERVRELCTEHGIVLCFDEVITGFRVGLGGAQAQIGVTPDLATFGKAMAGGAPVGAVAGKREIMDQLLDRTVVGAGTFNGHPFCLAAALATIKILEKDNGAVYGKIDSLQERLSDGLREMTQRHGLPALIQGPRGALFHHFCEGDVVYSARELFMNADAAKYTEFLSRLIDEGVLAIIGGRWYLSTALTETDVDEALERANRAMSKL